MCGSLWDTNLPASEFLSYARPLTLCPSRAIPAGCWATETLKRFGGAGGLRGPSPTPRRLSRSLALSSLDKHSEAVAYYRRALELDPGNETYKSNLKIAELKLRETPSPVSGPAEGGPWGGGPWRAGQVHAQGWPETHGKACHKGRSLAPRALDTGGRATQGSSRVGQEAGGNVGPCRGFRGEVGGRLTGLHTKGGPVRDGSLPLGIAYP